MRRFLAARRLSALSRPAIEGHSALERYMFRLYCPPTS